MKTISIFDVFDQLSDPRDPRGVRHKFSSILGLTFLGMLARIREMAVLVRWANVHWDLIKEPLGFDRDTPPSATTISRTLAGCKVEDFQNALKKWIRSIIELQGTSGIVAVDGKTSKQGIDGDEPLHMLNAFVHDLKVVVGQWSTGSEKTNEAGVLKNELKRLLEDYPMLKIITADALFAGRPVLKVIRDLDCDYMVGIKGNQKEVYESLEHCFKDVTTENASAETIEKRGPIPRLAMCG